MFVRKKTSGKRTYYYLVECSREGRKVRQRVVCYLGEFSTVEAAMSGLPPLVEKYRTGAAVEKERMRTAFAAWKESGYAVHGAEPPTSNAGRYVPHLNRIFVWYWLGKELHQKYTRLADEHAARLEQLRQAMQSCSAHDC